MNDHQRKMARKAGKACGYAHGGKVQSMDDEDVDDIIREQDEASAPTEEDRFGDYVNEVGPEAIHAYSARHRAKDAVVRKYGEPQYKRKLREAGEAADEAQQKLQDQHQRRRDFVTGRLRET